MNSLFKCLFISLIAGLLAAAPLQAATYYWINPTWGYVSDPANWDIGAVPGSAAGDRAAVNNGGLALIDATHTFGPNNIGSGQTIFSLFAGVGYPSAGPGAMQQSGSTVSTDSGLILGFYGTEASYGYYGISGGALNAKRASADPTYAAILVGNDHSGVFNQTGGTTTTVMAAGDGARTTVGWNTLGATVDNLMNIRGGTFGISGGSDYAFLLGFGGNVNVVNLGGTALVDLTGGGATPIGRMLMGGGGNLAVLNLGDVKSGLGGSGGSDGGGSVLTTASIHGLGAPSLVNFHGGTLQASTSTPPGEYTLLDGVTGYVYSEGAVIDTRSFNAKCNSELNAPTGGGVSSFTLSTPGSGFIGEPIVTLTDEGGSGTGATARAIVDLDPASPTFQQVTQIVVTNPGINYTGPVNVSFSGGGPNAVLPTVPATTPTQNISGGLTKIGTGSLALNANCNYTGATTVQEGTLALNGIRFGSSSIVVKSAATLAGFYGTDVTVPSLPSTTVESNGSIAPGSPGQILYLSELNLRDNSNLKFALSGSSVDEIYVDGNVSSGGSSPITVNVSYTGSLAQDMEVLRIIGGGALDSHITFALPGGKPALDSDDGVHSGVTLFANYAEGYLQLKAGGELAATVPAWNALGGGNWTENAKWGNTPPPPANQSPNGNDKRAMFTNSLGSSAIPIGLNISPTLSSMIIASPNGESYNITPSAGTSITLNSGIAQNWHITVLGGTHSVAANIKLGAGTGPSAGQSAIRLVDGSHLTLSGILSDETTAAGVHFEGNFNSGAGTGMLTLLGANTYTGPTSVAGGVLEVPTITNVNLPNALGKSGVDPANLVLNSGTLHYTGTAAATTDRGMTISGDSTILLNGDTTFSASQFVGAASASLTINGKMTLDSAMLGLTDATDQGKLWLGDNVLTVLNVNGSSQVTARSLLVGKTGGSDAGMGGAFRQTGGIVNVLGDGNNPYDNSFKGEVIGHSAYGYYKLSDGVLNMNVFAQSNYNPFIIGLNATGVFDQTGGAVNNPATSNILVGVGASSVMNVTGGIFQMSLAGPTGGIIVGTFHDGTLNIGGGSTAATVDTAAGIMILGRLEARGIINLAANGTLKTGGVYKGANIIPGETPGTAIMNFHGGVLKVGSAALNPLVASFMENIDHAYIYSEGAVIDTNGLDATIAQNLESASGSGIKKIDVASGGSGYIGTPVVTISGGTGSGATAVAVMNGDKVDHIAITNPGSGYDSADVLTVTLSGGGYATPASASIGTGTNYFAANVDGGLKKLGGGALTLSGALTYTGDTTVNEGTLNVTDLSTPSATVSVKDGAILNAVSITADTLTIGGVPETAAVAVPEPGTLALLALAVLGGIGMAWRKRK